MSRGNGKAIAIAIGILAMILGAGLWAVITVVTEHEFSLVAIGVGALVGLAMRCARRAAHGRPPARQGASMSAVTFASVPAMP